MIANFHTHTTFCDGKNTPEEIIRYAIDRGFTAIGFSGHCHTPFDPRYCMKDTEGYIADIRRLQAQYRDRIQVYLGVEEDVYSPVDRARFDYIITSCHYFRLRGIDYPIDSNYDYFRRCLQAFDYDIVRLAETYYSTFCAYLHRRKPDIIGHFDVITKFDEVDEPRFLCSETYHRIAAFYAAEAARSGCLMEVNTGAVARGLRTSFYPHERLLHVLKKEDARLILASDSHAIDTLDYGFEDAKALLRDIGFRTLYTLLDGGIASYAI